jgi:endonuclease/exonuclease/phosphatase (EEP) superfamily protein YafD
MTSATIDFHGQPVHFVTTHPLPPTGGPATTRWNRELRLIADLANAPPSGPFILAGDLNLTQHHRWYGRIADGPLADALRKLGMGNATTWPNGKLRLPSIRIDQVFISKEVVPLRGHVGQGHGSDHRPIVVDLAILPTRQVDAVQPAPALP